MSTIVAPWDEFMAAIDEARDLTERGASANELSELLRHARELLDIIEAEIAANQIDSPAGAAIGILAQLRSRLKQLELDVMPTRH